MIKHSSTTDHKGKLKEYFDQLKVSASDVCSFPVCVLANPTVFANALLV